MKKPASIFLLMGLVLLLGGTSLAQAPGENSSTIMQYGGGNYVQVDQDAHDTDVGGMPWDSTGRLSLSEHPQPGFMDDAFHEGQTQGEELDHEKAGEYTSDFGAGDGGGRLCGCRRQSE